MSIAAVCGCGARYSLKDEFAGRSIKCPKCGQAFVAPQVSQFPQADPIFDRDKFLIRQKRISISSKYFVGDERGNEIAFVHRPSGIGRVILLAFAIIAWIMLIAVALGSLAPNGGEGAGMLGVLAAVLIIVGIVGLIWLLAPKLDVTFYRDRAMRERLMTIRQEFRVALLNARYTLVDPAGNVLGSYHKNYLYNFFRKRWYINGPDGAPVCVALEDSILLSILRRFLGPMFGLLRTNFMITTPDFSDNLGEFNRKLTLFDRYVLDLTDDPGRTLDRRVALALGVLLDTGERR